MAKVTFITGDRSMTPITVGQVSLEMLRALGHGRTIITGSEGATEAVVAALAHAAEVPVEQYGTPVHTPEGHVDWDARHRAIAEAHQHDDLEIVFVHSDPMTSRVGRSLFEVWGDAVRIVSLHSML